MTQWLAQSTTGRVVDPGVSQQQQPPSAAAPTSAPIWQMLMADNIKLMSRRPAQQQSEGGPDPDSGDDSDSDSDDEIDAQPPSGTVGFLNVHA
eukprot:CAMPEP_0177765096 /NCGR_PEP_ID=MMETSP0491_2-20121128/7804_1 /TAXON_ID=63592 /ORGANISM="Tetraselmis chuii, Strain PLY429" /LENGTH=92 /DNA_ID=CAMNT_0019281411 /DNA_START=251 /DNA_END=530 /DNA_ORIENTATION=+